MTFLSSKYEETGRRASVVVTAVAGLLLQGCASGDQPIGLPPVAADLSGSAEEKQSGTQTAAARKEGGSVRASNALPTVSAGNGKGTDLRTTVASALQHSAALRRAQSDLAGTEVDVKIARAGYQPTISSSAGMGTDEEYDYNLTVAQPLYDWGQTRADVGRSRALQMEAEAKLLDVAEKTALEAVQAHIAVLRSRDLLDAARNNLVAHERFTRLASDRTEGGVGDATEVELAGVHQGEAESALEQARGALRNASSVYYARVGSKAPVLAPVPELPLYLGEDSNVDAAALNAPAVIAARARQDAARNAAVAERASLLPKLKAEAFVRGDEDSDDPTTGLGLRVVGPTLNGLSSFNRVEAANLQADSAKWAAEAARREATMSVRELFDNEPVLRSRIRILTAQLQKSRVLRDLYEDQFVIGERKVADLVTVQNDVYRIRRDLINARFDIMNLQYSAAAALGYLMDSLQVNLK